MLCALRCRRGSGLAVDQRVGTGGPGLSVRSASGGDRRRMWQWLRHLLGAEKLAAIFHHRDLSRLSRQPFKPAERPPYQRLCKSPASIKLGGVPSKELYAQRFAAVRSPHRRCVPHGPAYFKEKSAIDWLRGEGSVQGNLAQARSAKHPRFFGFLNYQDAGDDRTDVIASMTHHHAALIAKLIRQIGQGRLIGHNFDIRQVRCS
jgi:hypothetical protein